ncbi:hypothetical protein DIPPA_23214 [Diplonema papillatum]|nr:hypothetical protein DIPPA_23214 [Diplonema papillatum]
MRGLSVLGKTPWEKHIEMMALFRAQRSEAAKTDLELIRAEYRFIDAADEPADDAESSSGDAAAWARRVAQAYRDKLFREYALVDLTHHTKGLVGMRWRTESEVVAGKGQFSCGSLPVCGKATRLASLEVPFKFKEGGVKKEALVKVRLCRRCRAKLMVSRRVAAKKKKHLAVTSDDLHLDASSSEEEADEKEEDGRRSKSREQNGEDTNCDLAATERDESSAEPASKRRKRNPHESPAPAPEGPSADEYWAVRRKEADAACGVKKKQPSKEEEFDAFLKEMFP